MRLWGAATNPRTQFGGMGDLDFGLPRNSAWWRVEEVEMVRGAVTFHGMDAVFGMERREGTTGGLGMRT